MTNRSTNRQATQIRSSLKASIAQLDDWTASQADLRKRRIAANSSSGGFHKRILAAQTRARLSQGTQLLRDSPCCLCNSDSHLSDECDFIAVKASSKSTPEDPAAAIHRGIVHRLFSLSADLYRLLYPRFYPGAGRDVFATSDTSLSLASVFCSPDYQEIAIVQAVDTLAALPSSQRIATDSFQRQRAFVDTIAQPFHSAAFPLDYTEFRDQIQKRWRDKLETGDKI